MTMIRAAHLGAVSLFTVSSAGAADIVDTAVANGSFKTLVAAVQPARPVTRRT